MNRMNSKIQVALSYEDLYNAYTKNDNNHQYILDIETGELFSDLDNVKSEEEQDEIYEMLCEDPDGRYRSLPFMLIHDQRYQVKMEFIDAIENNDLRSRLFETTRVKKGHKQFLKVLGRAGELEQWNRYVKKYWSLDLKEWLEEEEIEIIDTGSRDIPVD